MKNVIIAGCSRCGKTTLSKYLREKYNLNHYKMDSIKRGIDKNFWDHYKDDWVIVSPHMAHLINQIINEREDEYLVIDTCHLYPEDIFKYNIKDTIIVFLGHDSISVDEKLKQIRKYDKHTWTNFKDDDYMRISTEEGIMYSKKAKEQCEKYNIKYFDTSYNFKEVMKEVERYIEDRL